MGSNEFIIWPVLGCLMTVILVMCLEQIKGYGGLVGALYMFAGYGEFRSELLAFGIRWILRLNFKMWAAIRVRIECHEMPFDASQKRDVAIYAVVEQSSNPNRIIVLFYI